MRRRRRWIVIEILLDDGESFFYHPMMFSLEQKIPENWELSSQDMVSVKADLATLLKLKFSPQFTSMTFKPYTKDKRIRSWKNELFTGIEIGWPPEKVYDPYDYANKYENSEWLRIVKDPSYIAVDSLRAMLPKILEEVKGVYYELRGCCFVDHGTNIKEGIFRISTPHTAPQRK